MASTLTSDSLSRTRAEAGKHRPGGFALILHLFPRAAATNHHELVALKTTKICSLTVLKDRHWNSNPPSRETPSLHLPVSLPRLRAHDSKLHLLLHMASLRVFCLLSHIRTLVHVPLRYSRESSSQDPYLSHLPRPLFQIKSHSQVLGIRMWTYSFEATIASTFPHHDNHPIHPGLLSS